jgi:ATP-dependent helicase/nuclease subunit B
MLSRQELFARLGAGAAARLTVVTPNRRLSQALEREFDGLQIARGLQVWDAPEILPFGAFIGRLYDDAFYAARGGLKPLLNPAQEEQVWRQVVARSGLLILDAAAARCREAWALSHEWRVRIGHGNEDARAFQEWASQYSKKTAAEIDAARLPDFLLEQKDLALPKALVAYAFDILPPQTREFLERLAERGVEVLHCRPDAKAARAARAAYRSAKEELEAAAAWARARLEANPRARIGVVVPELEQRRREVARVFSRVMRPGFNLPGAAPAAMPFNISIGIPLVQYPVVALALSILELSQGEVAFEEVSRIVRSPFIGGAEKELAARAQLDARLRRKLGASVSLPKLIAGADRAPILRGLLERIFALRDDGLFSAKTPSEWARHVSALLEAAGYPGERTLDSAEFQARARWHEVLSGLSALDRVSGALPPKEFLSLLRRACADATFQPESDPATPVQVLGVLESAGAGFEHLWVGGLTDEAWPLKARPNPFLPVAAQKAAGIPEASAEGSLALDRRITEGWLGAADEVVFSSFTHDSDRELGPSPLILAVPEQSIEIPAFLDLGQLIFKKRKVEALEDSVGPAVTATEIRGGTRVLSDQSACPFRAFARWRLEAEPLEAPADGLDAAKRGTLVHALMKNLWGVLKDSTALGKDLSAAIEQAASAAVKELELEGRFADLERARLARLAREWLEIERARPPFEVVAIEKSQPVKVAGIEFSGRIDRMDRLSTGGHALIDYKTNRNPTSNQWKPPRPDDPQLPLYAVAAKEEIAAVVFAKVRPGEMRFMGFSRGDNQLPETRKAKDWNSLLEGWRREAEALGGAFAAGAARVDPKRELATCRYCAMHALCRVYEKVNVLAETEEGEE